MILIDKGMTNSCVFTLNEKRTLAASQSNVFIQIYSNQDNYNKLMWLNDNISTNTIRYDEYEIVETSAEDLMNQRIELDVATYDYFVHETPLGATLSLTSSVAILESGLLTCSGTISTTFTYDEGDDDRDYTFV